MKRQHEHPLAVIAAQRERADKAFDEMKLARLEQELAARAHKERLGKAFDEVKLAMLEQELGVRASAQETNQLLVDLSAVTKAHGDELAELRQTVATLADLPARVQKLEQQNQR